MKFIQILAVVYAAAVLLGLTALTVWAWMQPKIDSTHDEWIFTVLLVLVTIVLSLLWQNRKSL